MIENSADFCYVASTEYSALPSSSASGASLVTGTHVFNLKLDALDFARYGKLPK